MARCFSICKTIFDILKLENNKWFYFVSLFFCFSFLLVFLFFLFVLVFFSFSNLLSFSILQSRWEMKMKSDEDRGMETSQIPTASTSNPNKIPQSSVRAAVLQWPHPGHQQRHNMVVWSTRQNGFGRSTSDSSSIISIRDLQEYSSQKNSSS